MTDQNSKPELNSNSAFIFGLSLGAAVGALSAILVHKNSDKEVVQNFEAKVKDFFQDLISEVTTQKTQTVKKIVGAIQESPFEEKPPVVTKKPTPKTFLKPKK